MRTDFLLFHRPYIAKDEIQEVIDTLKSGWLTTGPKTKQFEKEFASYIGSKHAITVNSGTAALHLALDAIGLKQGERVILPTMTFAATAEAVIYFRAKPVLVDCQKDTFNIDLDQVEEYLDKNPYKVKAIIPVHIAGQPCEMDRVLEIAKRFNLKVIEDAAHALSAKYKERVIGRIGDIAAFSFYVTKSITTGEGGMVTTDDNEYAEMIRKMSLHGISKDAWKRYTSEGSWYYEILRPGYKYNMTDIASAIGIHQLRKCDWFYEKRKEIAQMYTRAFKEMEEIQEPVVKPYIQHAWHLYIIQLNLEKLTMDRARFIQEMKNRNIGTSVHFIPLHMHPYYRKMYGYKPEDFSGAKYVYERIVSLPIYPKMKKEDVEDVVWAVKDIVAKYRK
ncbi:DegT/DnrJ/EryC1/StrS family aminotransferase [Candidatus Aerophobetes bacterium]|uniref:DegT/DnrJ/EryC1/StrS family aminotransferase n=1 Tax=Aerophobetes bacterium TaxID=2030807 RepID=A0A523S1L0_UNCAE|nr:MAG: DegT/DnrJ/EryC1/StrS family aminotransferase [Candidatus Aerophobetes bacterium]